MNTTALSIDTLNAGWDQLSFDLAPDRVAPPTILVVDDEPDHLRFIARSLERLGYGVLKAADGKRAMAMLRSNSVQLVVTDALMPEMDGPSLIDTIRRSRITARLPVILLTASSPELADLVLQHNGPDMLCLKRDAAELLPRQVEFLLA